MAGLTRDELITNIREVDQQYNARFLEMEQINIRIEELKKQKQSYMNRRQQQLFEQDQLTEAMVKKREKIKIKLAKEVASKQLKMNQHQHFLAEHAHDMEVHSRILDENRAYKITLEEQYQQHQNKSYTSNDKDQVAEQLHNAEVERNTLQTTLDTEILKGRHLTEKLGTLRKEVHHIKDKYEEVSSALKENYALIDDLTVSLSSLKIELRMIGGGPHKAEEKMSLFDEVNVNRVDTHANCIRLSETYKHMKNMREGLLQKLAGLKIENADLNNKAEQLYQDVHFDWMTIEYSYRDLLKTLEAVMEEFDRIVDIRKSIENKVLGPEECNSFYNLVEKFMANNVAMNKKLVAIRCLNANFKCDTDQAIHKEKMLTEQSEKMKHTFTEVKKTIEIIEPLERSAELICICSLQSSDEKK